MSCDGGHLGFLIGIIKEKLCRGPPNDHSWAVLVSIAQVVSEKKRFESFFP
jgi:hypothetical protein